MTNFGHHKIEKYEDRSRYVKRLHSRVMRRRRFQLTIFALALSAVLVWFSINAYNALKNFHFPKIGFAKTAIVEKKKPKVKKISFALIGLEQREYEEYASGVSVVVYDPAEKKISGLSFNKDLRIQIPGYGLDLVEKVLFAGTKPALYAITNVTGVKVDKYVMIDKEDYSTNKKSIKKIFKSIYESNFTQKEQEELEKKFKDVNNEDINILEAPSRSVAVGSKPYKQLKKKEVNRLVQVLWGLEKPLKRTRAMVLNGIGTSGLAGKVAIKLINGNYEVLDIKNANSFTYKNTVIVASSLKMQKEAMAVQKILGYGNIMLEQDKQRLTDITVIIGRDHKEK